MIISKRYANNHVFSKFGKISFDKDGISHDLKEAEEKVLAKSKVFVYKAEAKKTEAPKKETVKNDEKGAPEKAPAKKVTRRRSTAKASSK